MRKGAINRLSRCVHGGRIFLTGMVKHIWTVCYKVIICFPFLCNSRSDRVIIKFMNESFR